MDDPRARLFLIRHGESEVNAHTPHLVGGRSSWAELTPEGKAQARALGRGWLAEIGSDDLVLASTAVRATQTARYALQEAGVPLTRLQTHPDLEEIDQGAWTGRPRNEIYTPAQQVVIDDDHWTFAPPRGESQADVFARASSLLHREVVEPGRTAFVICHGIVITSLLAGWLGLDRQTAWQIRIANASVTRLAHDGRRFVELVRDDVTHLGDR